MRGAGAAPAGAACGRLEKKNPKRRVDGFEMGSPKVFFESSSVFWVCVFLGGCFFFFLCVGGGDDLMVVLTEGGNPQARLGQSLVFFEGA